MGVDDASYPYPSAFNGKVGGIMFWAVNEGARAPNGKTTGENSVALANYAAAL